MNTNDVKQRPYAAAVLPSAAWDRFDKLTVVFLLIAIIASTVVMVYYAFFYNTKTLDPNSELRNQFTTNTDSLMTTRIPSP
jgi:hypothetical protein